MAAFIPAWPRAAAPSKRRSKACRGRICRNLSEPSVNFKFYLLRTRKREHRNGNKNMCLPLGGRQCHFYSFGGSFCLWTSSRGLSAKVEKGRYGASAGREPAFIPIKLRNETKNLLSWVPLGLKTGGDRARRLSVLAHWPWSLSSGCTRLPRKASVLCILQFLVFRCSGYTGVISRLD